MTTEDFIIDLFCRVDDAMLSVPKHSQSHLYPSELVTVASCSPGRASASGRSTAG